MDPDEKWEKKACVQSIHYKHPGAFIMSVSPDETQDPVLARIRQENTLPSIIPKAEHLRIRDAGLSIATPSSSDGIHSDTDRRHTPES